MEIEVLNLILSGLDEKVYSIQPVKNKKNTFTLKFDNREIAEVEVFPENEGLNFNWVKVNK